MILSAQVIELAPILIALGTMFSASILVERFLVLIDWFISRMLIVNASRNKELDKRLDKKFIRKLKEAELAGAAIESNPNDARDFIPSPENPNSDFQLDKLVSSEEIHDPDMLAAAILKENKIRKEFWMQVLGVFVGIIGCWYSGFSIWGFVEWGGQLTNPDSKELEAFLVAPEYIDWKIVFTGIIIGAGSKPVNFLMNFLLNRKIRVIRSGKDASKMTGDNKGENEVGGLNVIGPVSVNSKSIEEIVGFTYDGGIEPAALEDVHFFNFNASKPIIDKIVIHHTAMHSDSTMEDLVDLIPWITAYNCVVFKDGTIRVYCRWDRFGNHAGREINKRSLGIALMGNFDTDHPKKPFFGNKNGEFGMKRPTNVQFDAAARVVALWTQMHDDIPLDFPTKVPNAKADTYKGIIPHNHIKNKACPGAGFDLVKFEKKVREYVDKWNHSTFKDEFEDALDEFKAFPRVMPTP